MLDDPAVTRLLHRVSRFVLVSHYLWTVWAVVRAPDTITFSDFDFLHYARARWDAYKRVKSELLMSEASQTMPMTPNTSFVVGTQGEPQVMSRTPSERSFGAETVDQPPQPPKMSYIMMGGVLTGCGVLVGITAVVAVVKALQR